MGGGCLLYTVVCCYVDYVYMLYSCIVGCILVYAVCVCCCCAIMLLLCVYVVLSVLYV